MIGKLLNSIRSITKSVRTAEVIKVFSSTALSTLIRMLTGFISVKVVSEIVGPSGLAMLGQLNNFVTIMLMLASGGINNGITKYVSEFNNVDGGGVDKYIATAAKIVIGCSFFVGTLLLVFNSLLSRELLHNESYAFIFIVFGCTVVFYGLNTMLLSIVNGFKDFKKYVSISIFDSVIGLGFSLVLVLCWGVKGALLSTVTYQSVTLLITILFLRKSAWLNLRALRGKFDRVIVGKYFRYSLMTLVTAATVPMSQIILRQYVITNISSEQAGLWEGMNRISNMYLLVITTSFSVYYLPRLSEISRTKALRHEIFKFYKILIPILIIGLTSIYFLRNFVINLIFSSSFGPMESLFIFQLIGDFFKIVSWVLACLMLAKTMTKTYIATELVFSFSFVLIGLLLSKLNGVVGLTQAYLVNYVIYFITMVFLFRKLIFVKSLAVHGELFLNSTRTCGRSEE